MNARMGDFIAKSDFCTMSAAKRLFFFGGILAIGLRNRFRKDFGTVLSLLETMVFEKYHSETKIFEWYY